MDGWLFEARGGVEDRKQLRETINAEIDQIPALQISDSANLADDRPRGSQWQRETERGPSSCEVMVRVLGLGGTGQGFRLTDLDARQDTLDALADSN